MSEKNRQGDKWFRAEIQGHEPVSAILLRHSAEPTENDCDVDRAGTELGTAIRTNSLYLAEGSNGNNGASQRSHPTGKNGTGNFSGLPPATRA